MPDLDLSTDVFNPFASEDIAPAHSLEWEAKRRLASALRDLIELTVTSAASAETLNRNSEALEQLSASLARAPRCSGLKSLVASGAHGGYAEINHEINAVGGMSNPLAPPMNIWLEGTQARGRVRCGYAYEGPPGFVHGGYVAAIFDQFLGMAQLAGGRPGMTASLQVRYLRPTPLNTELQLTGALQFTEGRKTRVEGQISAGDTITATAEALFVRPAQGLGGLARES